MPLGEDVAQYLGGIGALGLTPGTSVFGQPFPEAATTDRAVCVIETPGEEDGNSGGPSLSRSSFENARFQVLVRDGKNNAEACQALARSIRLNLNRLAGTTIGDTEVLLCKALTRPFYLSVDQNGRHRYATNYEMTLRDVGST